MIEIEMIEIEIEIRIKIRKYTRDSQLKTLKLR